MKFTKSQKIYSGVLGVGICAFLYDRCCNGPKAPLTPVAVNASISTDRLDPVALSSCATSTDANDVPGRLRLLQKALPAFPQVRDAFVPSSAWIVSGCKQEIGPSEKVATFQKTHRLRAILDMSGRGQAIVNNELLTVGQSMDGFMLTSVGNLKAIFRDGDTTVILTLPTPGEE
jgi:hypothetical protein